MYVHICLRTLTGPVIAQSDAAIASDVSLVNGNILLYINVVPYKHCILCTYLLFCKRSISIHH